MSQPGTPQSTVETAGIERQAPPPELVEIRRKLRDRRELILDDDLRDEVDTWIRESWTTDADTAAEYVEGELNSLLEEYPMYAGPDVEAGEGFPDRCAGCPHAGSRCPLLIGVKSDARDRLVRESETEADVRRVYEKQARESGCRVIPGALSEWDEHHSEFIRRGDDLLRAITNQALGVDKAAEEGRD